MRKEIILPPNFNTGEMTVQPVYLFDGGRRQDTSRITKHASEALDYIKNVMPEPGKTQMLLLAMGGEETYGPNRNGDGFPERPVPAKNKVASSGDRWWVAPGEELTQHYHTFETNPAHAFKHHVNKDPKKGSGHVKKAFWNPKMHRVELLVVIDNDKDPEWVQRVNDGDFPAVSMGCRIKYDVCSICGNKAPTRKDYCEHVTSDPGMNQLMPDGRKAYVHNPSPNFFDISRVFRPADRTGYTLKKVAEAQPYELWSSAALGDARDDIENKSAQIRKLSDIEKVIRGTPVASASLSPDEAKVIRQFKDYATTRLAFPVLPREVLAAYRPREVFSTLADMGITLTGREFVDYMMPKLGGYVPADVRDRVVAEQGVALSALADAPTLLAKIGSLFTPDAAHVNEKLRQALWGFQEKRGSVTGMLGRAMVPDTIGVRPEEAPTTDMLTYSDPTGRRYSTTRGAAIDAHDAIAKRQIAKMLGGSALLLGAYKALSAHPSLRAWRTPLAMGTGALGMAVLPPRSGPMLHTDQGLDVSRYTEFAPVGENERRAAYVVGLVADYQNASPSRGEDPKVAGVEDLITGLDVDFDDVAEALGSRIIP